MIADEFMISPRFGPLLEMKLVHPPGSTASRTATQALNPSREAIPLPQI
jgi:hypothetical protein